MPKIGGIVSGLDTSGILEQLKSIAQRPIVALQARQTQLDLKTAAWDSMSAKFNALRVSATAVTNKFATKPTKASSSDATLLEAQVTGTAQEGVRVVRVLQMARGEESLSNRFAAIDSEVMASGTITLGVGDGTLDRDLTSTMSLSMLNNGAGVTLGSIRITDRSGASAVVDLTGHTTVQDVLDDISGLAGVNVTAKLNSNGTGILLQDDTGLTTGALTVEEEGGSTAASLNLLGTSTTGILEGGDLAPLYQITVDSSNNTLAGIRDAINAFGGPFSAAIVNDGDATQPYRLSIVSRYSGESAQIALTSSDPGLTFIETQTAQDAQVEIGTTAPQLFKSRTNVFASAIQGVSFTLAAADVNKTVDIKVESNVQDAVSTVKTFIESYNAIVSALAKENSYNAETKSKGGPLFNNPLLSTAVAGITDSIISPVNGLSTQVSSLFQIGVKAGQGGLLEIDEAILSDWTKNNFTDVQALFTSTLNGALAATRTASSTASGYDVNRVSNGVIDPVRFGPDPSDGWMDDTASTFPDYVTLQFSSPRTVTRAVVHTLDTDANPVASWGLKDYDLQALRIGGNPAEESHWTSLASVRGNTRGVNSQVINYFTEQLRVKVLDVHAADGLSRIVEFEAFEATGTSRRTSAFISRIADNVDGIFSSARKEVTEERNRLETQISATNERVDREMARLEKQFIQMEQAMSRNQTNSQALSNFLNNGVVQSSSR
ncbi:MAG: flagellar filament capping protein FliD [Elusimicrobia bacterium]|jgi:flagellar capping protein FliD|nr:flagellar filament capping protein FliD [Elusimicrobiota bacterium]